jgi:predicted porin
MFTAQGGSSSQSASPSAGIVGSFHQQFGPWLGYRVTSSYARNTFAYADTTFITGSPNAISSNSLVNGSTYELTFAYTVQGPSSKRISTDAEVGGGALLIEPSLSPGTAPSMLERNHRRTALGGVGFNFKLNPHLDLRAEYRILVFNNPGFGYSPDTRVTASSRPTVGMTYHFGKSGDK